MKSKKIISFVLLFAILITSLCSCNFVDGIVNAFSPTQPDNDDTIGSGNGSAENIGVETSPEMYCYTISCSSESSSKSSTFDLGEEITLTVKAQVYHDSRGNYWSARLRNKDFRMIFTIEESPYFELISDAVVVLTNESLELQNCICGNEADEYMTANFKIKINEPDYNVNAIKISMTDEYTIEDPYEVRKYTHALMPVHYFTDSQGVLINPTTNGYNHPGHILTSQLRIISYDREYLNGMTSDELVDRYLALKYGDNIICGHAKLEKLTKDSIFAFKREYKYAYQIFYVSQGLRFKMTLTSLSEGECKTLDGRRGDRYYAPETAYSTLQLALKYNIISQEEFDAEVDRISNKAEKCIYARYIDLALVFENPSKEDYFLVGTIFQGEINGDNYFNYVFDERVDW